jgi:hypothetical protein
LLLLFFVWFTAVHVYYGITLDATNLGSGDSAVDDGTGETPPKTMGMSLYVLSFLLNLFSIPAQTLSAVAIQRFGGPRSLFHAFWLSGTSFVTAAILVNVGLLKFASIAVLVGSFFENFAFCTLYSATAVMFPTLVRNTAMGWLASVSKIGAMLAPVVVHGLGAADLSVPLWVFGAMCFICSFVMAWFGAVWEVEQSDEVTEETKGVEHESFVGVVAGGPSEDQSALLNGIDRG